MELRDTTVEANSGPEMEQYFLYKMQSKADRWGLAVEHPELERFTVAVTFQDAGWGLDGVARYWVFAARDEAEARFLELQRVLGALDEDLPLKELVAKLPEEDERPEPAEDEA